MKWRKKRKHIKEGLIINWFVLKVFDWVRGNFGKTENKIKKNCRICLFGPENLKKVHAGTVRTKSNCKRKTFEITWNQRRKLREKLLTFCYQVSCESKKTKVENQRMFFWTDWSSNRMFQFVFSEMVSPPFPTLSCGFYVFNPALI